MIWLICDSLSFYAHVHICSPRYTDEEQKTKVDSETVCLRLLIKGLVVPIRLYVLSKAYYKLNYIRKFKRLILNYFITKQFLKIDWHFNPAI